MKDASAIKHSYLFGVFIHVSTTQEQDKVGRLDLRSNHDHLHRWERFGNHDLLFAPKKQVVQLYRLRRQERQRTIRLVFAVSVRRLALGDRSILAIQHQRWHVVLERAVVEAGRG
jgi:hypothetical protein